MVAGLNLPERKGLRMDWARIMAPLSGGEGDRRLAVAALAVARPFAAELACVHAPADVADLIPWMGDGFMGGVQATAVESIRQAAQEGEAAARAVFDALDYEKKTFTALKSPVWSALAMEGRLSDVLVFDDAAARGKGSLAEAFQQVVANEQRPTIVARPGLKVGGVVAVAWDGGKEASRAMRTALPLLQQAARVVVLHAPTASSRKCDPPRLQAFLAARGVVSEVETLTASGEVAPALTAAATAAGADILVAGAYGHPRLREFIFGGATRTFLNADSPSLFLSH
jgi:nucleotide-binding universal stress UspA family protein